MKVKLYRGSVGRLTEKYGNKVLPVYEFALTLKALYPYSYISDYHNKITVTAKLLNISRRTFKRRMQKLKDKQFCYMEGSTLRIISNSYIKKALSKKRANKYSYREIHTANLRAAITAQPLEENITRQSQARKNKIRRSGTKQVSAQSNFRYSILQSPHARIEVNDQTILSQRKAASLLGYKSASSGYKALKFLKDNNYIQIENNSVEISRAAYNDYKNKGTRNILIKGKGENARFYYCIANTITLVKDKDRNITTTAKKTSWATNSYFQDNW